ncbi:toxin CptA [Oxalobacteraceae bacterium GrIS 2.11]
MSIALSIVLRPSRKLHVIAILFSIQLVLIGIYLGCQTSISLYYRFPLACLCMLVSFGNFINIHEYVKKIWHIHVSNQGEIRCDVKSLCIDAHDNGGESHYVLNEGCTLWSNILFLRLRSLNSDSKINLVILSDSLNNDEFRRLSLACRWLAQQVRK